MATSNKARLHKPHHHLDWAASNAQMLNQTFALALAQHLDWSMRRHCHLEANVLWIVQVTYREAIEPE